MVIIGRPSFNLRTAERGAIMQTSGDNRFSGRYDDDLHLMESILRVGDSFDMIARKILVGGRRAAVFFVDGFVKDEVMEKILEYLMKLKPEDLQGLKTAEQFAAQFVTYVEVDTVKEADKVAVQVLSGTIGLLLEGYGQVVMIDARTYPARGVEEPDDDRVLRGSHDGFVETLVFNTALIRRRIRDPRLTMEILQIGQVSQTDVVLCYLQGRADERLLEKVKKKLQSIQINTLTLGQESLSECLLRRQWYNPFPKIRYTERPDCAAASVVEGQILIIVDNAPGVMILPTSIFDFIQDTNDYYFPPLVGSYLRMVRAVVFFFTLFLTPVWYLLLKNPELIPPWLEFIRVAEPNSVPIILQLIIIELIVDGVKLASLNTPSALNNAFGVVGALILGEFAVTARLFVPEVMLYMAFVTISNFTQPSFELGYAFKLFRILFLILTALFSLWGFAAGVLLMVVVIATTDTIGGKKYLYPLIPFNGKAMMRLLLRKPISHDNT